MSAPLVRAAARAGSFLDLMAIHRELEDLFLRHQEALIGLEITRAIGLLEAYERTLLAHMRDEEEAMIPVYELRAGRIPGGPVELFLGEHRKMRAFLGRFHDALAALLAMDPAGRPRAVIALMDHQAMYKHLVEHHDLREKNVLYPQLDRVTSPAERAGLLAAALRGG